MLVTDLFSLFLERHVGAVHLLLLPIMSLTLAMCSGSSGSTGNGQETMQPGASQLVQVAYLKASNTETGDWFGTWVAMSGETLVVGARTEDSAATGIGGNQADNSAETSGAAYVFIRTGGIWNQLAYLKASNTHAGDGFGLWVDVEGDTVAVGAPFQDGGGAVYVFTRTGGVWSQQAFMKASNPTPNDGFGSSVALSGDTLVVGARFEDSSAQSIDGNQADISARNSGAAYVFTRTGQVWSQQAYIKASNSEAGDRFGYSVDVSGNTLVVSAPSEDSAATGINGNLGDNSAPDSGAAYVFTRTNGVWSQEAYVKPSNTGSGDGFGNQVAIAGDTFLVGAPFEDSAATGINGNLGDNSAPDSGAAYVFTRTNGVWSQETYMKASNTEAGDNFGFHVAMAPDTLIVGAIPEDSAATGINSNQADNTAPDSGGAYLFTRTGGIWNQQAYVKPSNTEAGDWFGGSFAVEGDTVVVGAVLEDSAATGVGGNQGDNSTPSSGAVYVFQLQ